MQILLFVFPLVFKIQTIKWSKNTRLQKQEMKWKGILCWLRLRVVEGNVKFYAWQRTTAEWHFTKFQTKHNMQKVNRKYKLKIIAASKNAGNVRRHKENLLWVSIEVTKAKRGAWKWISLVSQQRGKWKFTA